MSEKPESSTAWWAILISVVGLVATNIWAWTQFSHQSDQIATQQAALSAQQAALVQAKNQFQEAHGALSISVVVEARDKSTGTWTSSQDDDIYRGKTLDADFFNSHDTYVMIVVANKGTGPTDVTFAGLVIDDSGKTRGADSAIQCTKENPGKLEQCAFPLRIEAQATQYIYVWSNGSTDQMTCNDYVAKHGLVGGVRDVSGELITAEAGAQIAWSTTCTSEATATATATPTAPTTAAPTVTAGAPTASAASPTD